MNDPIGTLMCALFFVVVLLVVGGGCGYSVAYDSAFEQGYIAACGDFYAGKCKYELRDKPDGTRMWVKKTEEDKSKKMSTDGEEASKGCATITIILFVILLMVAVWWLGYRAGYGDGYIRGVAEFKELHPRTLPGVAEENTHGQ